MQSASVNGLPAPNDEEVTAFLQELGDFVDRWHGRDEIDNLRTAFALLSGTDVEAIKTLFLDGGSDIGVEQWKNVTPADLHRSLGFEDGLPITFRRRFEEDESEVTIGWHQLVFVAALIAQYANSSQADVPGILYNSREDVIAKALLGIQEQWGRNHAVALLDEVGLGKTVCCITAIAALQTIYALEGKAPDNRSTLPACIRTGKKSINILSI